MIVMREVFKRDKPLDNGSGAVNICVFHSNVKPDECGALTVTPTKDYCRRDVHSTRPVRILTEGLAMPQGRSVRKGLNL